VEGLVGKVQIETPFFFFFFPPPLLSGRGEVVATNRKHEAFIFEPAVVVRKV